MVLFYPPAPPLPPLPAWEQPLPPREASPIRPPALSQCHARLAICTTAPPPRASLVLQAPTSLSGDRQRAGRAPQTLQLTLLEALGWSSARDKTVHSTQRREW